MDDAKTPYRTSFVLPRGLVAKLQEEADGAYRSMSKQLTVILQKRYEKGAEK